jgi:hypothetical protein
MTSKPARFSIAAVTLVLAACTSSASATPPGGTTQPVSLQASNAAASQAPSPSGEPSTSPTTSSGGAASAQPTLEPIDPCTLLTQAEASHLIGVSLGAGKQQAVGPDKVCTFAKGTTEVKIFLSPPTDPAGAKAYYESHKSEIPSEAHITELPTFFDGSVIARASLPIGSISGIWVLDGIRFFELYCGLPDCNDAALKGGSELIEGRLPR